jgi:uncharacterized membrane-anchored protein YhcB (DUF1043 family)
MSVEFENAERLLVKLREAYRDLPQHIRVHVKYLLRESSLQKHPQRPVCELASGTEAVIGVFDTQLRNS